MRKFEIPKWVYAVLEKNKNVALPNVCMSMNRQSLKRHLEKVVGFKLKIRECEIKSCDTRFLQRRIKIHPYLVAEAK